jgi:esterase
MSQLNYQQIGQGADVILIHGLFGSLENLNMVAKPLAEHYRVTSIDTRNHGSSFHSNTMSYQEMADDLLALMDHLNIHKAHILGHSMGGKIAMQFAVQHSERVAKLIVADIAPVTYQPRHHDIFAGLNAIDLKSVNKRSQADKTLSEYVNELGVRQFLLKNLTLSDSGAQFKCNLAAISQCYDEILAWPEAKQSFTHETLFIKGANSDYITSDYRGAIGKQFPNAKAKIIQGAGHWLHAEKTTAFNKIVTDFLSN